MSEDKKAKLEKAGWVETTVAEFLNLDEKDQMIVELRAQLSQAREALEEMAQPVQAPNGGHCSVKEAIKVAMDDYNWMKIKARAALAAMKEG